MEVLVLVFGLKNIKTYNSLSAPRYWPSIWAQNNGNNRKKQEAISIWWKTSNNL